MSRLKYRTHCNWTPSSEAIRIDERRSGRLIYPYLSLHSIKPPATTTISAGLAGLAQLRGGFSPSVSLPDSSGLDVGFAATSGVLLIFTALIFVLTHLRIKDLCPQCVGTKRWADTPIGTQHLVVHETVSSFIATPMICVLYVWGASELSTGRLEGGMGGASLESHDIISRFRGSTWASQTGLIIHCGMMLYDLSFVYPKDPEKTAIYYIHHVVALLVLWPVIAWRRFQYYACITGLVEATNPLIGAAQNMDRLRVMDLDYSPGGPLDQWDWERISIIIGAALVFFWILIRLLGLPLILMTFLRDLPVYMRASSGGGPNLGLSLDYFFAYACSGSAVAIWILSCYWFKLIIDKALETLNQTTTTTTEKHESPPSLPPSASQ